MASDRIMHLKAKVTYRITNRKALRALGRVREVLEDVAEDFGYRDDVKDAVKAAQLRTETLRSEGRARRRGG